MKKRNGIKIALLVVAAVLTVGLAGAWAMFGTQLKEVQTIQKLDDGLWSMERLSPEINVPCVTAVSAIVPKSPSRCWGTRSRNNAGLNITAAKSNQYQKKRSEKYV